MEVEKQIVRDLAATRDPTAYEGVLLTTMEVEGTIKALWPDGSAMLLADDGDLIACGVLAMVHLTEQPR